MTHQLMTAWEHPAGATANVAAASDAGRRGNPAIDRAVLGEWLAGDDAGIDELLVVFRDSVQAEQEQMREALSIGDLDTYAAAAHRLRGAALSMGARALAEVAGTLNAAARANDAVACRNGLSV